MTRARKFLRGSTGKQEEEKQLEDVQSYIAAREYTDDGKSYLAHGKSAYKGKHLPVLDEALRDMARSEYDVLVLWDSSRFTRMGAESIFTLMGKAREAGGKIEFAAEHAQGLNAATRWTPVLLAVQATSDNMQSRQRGEHTHREIRRKQQVGSAFGKPPWGFTVVGTKDHKRFVPTELGRKWIPRLYDAVIHGKSTRQIAKEWSDIRVDGKQWGDSSIQAMLNNPCYYGARRNGGNLVTEALVDFGTWQAAVEAHKSRNRRGPSAVKHLPPLVRPCCAACYGIKREGAPMGLSTMYVIRNPSGQWYRCSGSGKLRTGCGARVVPAAEFDAIVLERFGSSPLPHRKRVLIPGWNTAEALLDLNRAIAEAAAAGDYKTVADLSAKAQEAAESKDVRGRWELQDTGMTIGEYFRCLDREGQRAYIAECVLLAERDEAGRVIVREVILSDEGGAAIDRWA